MSIVYDRRSFLKTTTLTVGAAALPMTLVELAFAQGDKGRAAETFTFAYISDSHIQNIKGTQFVRNWDRGLLLRGRGDQPADAEARFHCVRRRPRSARHQGGA